ncbi:MAG: methyltransferase domain-containing protein [Acidimicrobiia bacterium]|nr:methyltransferase domain-containing protein [Acidimicrobiia bacterium]
MARPDNEVYTHSHQPVVLASYGTRTAEEAAAFLLSHLKPGMRILDLGCGPGSITLGLARYVAPAETVGVDQSEEALATARALAREQNVGNVRFEQADVYELPFDDATFDVVYGHQILQHLADPVAALTEAGRVLRAGGYLAVRDADYGTMTHHPHDPMIDNWLGAYHQVARANGGEPDAGRRLMEWVGAAGFEHLHATAAAWLYATPEERRGWAELWAGRRLREPADNSVYGEDFDQIVEAFHRWAAKPDGWFAFIHGEVLARKP